MKKATGQLLADGHYDLVNTETGECTPRKAEYTTMSRRPHGIGKLWFEQFSSDVFPDDFVISNGHKARPPKYYDSQYEILQPEEYKQLKERRVKGAAKHHANNTPERLAVREEIQTIKLNQLNREL